MILGMTIEKLVVIGILAALVLGPERLPQYAASLARMTARIREFLNAARVRVRDEVGDDFDDVDWRSLDPRQYDPRRIIRDALLEEPETPKKSDAQLAQEAGARLWEADLDALKSDAPSTRDSESAPGSPTANAS